MPRTIAAALTPLRDDGAALDEDALQPYLIYLSDAGIDGILLLGTTGEGILLTVEERKRAISNAVGGPLPVPAKDDRRMFRIELQRANSCSVVVPIELAHAKDGRWLVVGTDLAAVGNPAEPCKR